MTSGTRTYSPIALVTGANKGIGRAIAQQLAERGMTVYLGARDEKRGKAAERELRDAGLDARAVLLEVTDETSVMAAAQRIEKEQGRLDVLVNNAGTMPPWQPASQTPTGEARRVFELNVVGVVTVTNTLLPLLRRSQAGRIVNIGSSLGSLMLAALKVCPGATYPPGSFPQFAAYTASKAALNALTIMYADELRDAGILVNTACPGYTATDLTQGAGPRTVEQAARIPVLLATLPDGGRTGTFTGSDVNLVELPLPW
ncbi:SDR family oxidoreductase [Streptomyces sp. H27-H1]|uniref:SDR family oxidoreductase n=1 Tax=Streptomyces sp. H27-H1 TaxID=2996461 RepID=UPI00226F74DC|nr:SDR family oxidoreductase [Streptomyces sp. H27-H1]MCY0932494.1 SDR family oxidoreductase [Streptomyces sp. H27-H1]